MREKAARVKSSGTRGQKPSAVNTLLSFFESDAEKAKTHLVSLAILVLMIAACLLPFLNKAFHIDDPLYLWTARQIQSNPFDFYGYTVNWYGNEMPMSEVMKNPPLASYYIAMVAGLFGWAESTMHLAFFVPAVAVVIGTYCLAGEFCLTPLAAALVGICTPVFLLSGTTVMCDMMMLSFWVWATLLWIRGLKNGSTPALIAAAVLIALSSLTKYYGMCLIPLLFVYSLAKERRLDRWMPFLFIPVIILALYQWYTFTLYGKGLLLDASSYALEHQQGGVRNFFTKGLIGLFFTGGCLISILFFSFFLWRTRTLIIGAVLLLPFIVYYVSQLAPHGLAYTGDNRINWPFVVHCYLFPAAGIGVLCLAASDLWRGKDADSLFLFLWIVGTFVFASFVNWTVNGRSVLPMFPAMGILVLRRMEHRNALNGPMTASVLLPLVPALLIALSVTWVDYKWANIARKEAVALSHQNGKGPRTVWFQGHWGFQYYMQEHGGRAIDLNKSILERGDAVVVPSNNTSIEPMPEDRFKSLQVRIVAPVKWLSASNDSTGAGFYSSGVGPLPFVFGRVPEVTYTVFRATGKK